MKNFTNLYSLSKTLRFELKPVGNTLENMAHIIKQDEHRAENYKLVKKIIDKYHRNFIDSALSYCTFVIHDKDLLQEYYELYTTKRDEKQEKAFVDVQARLRKAVVNTFKAQERFKRLDKKELIQNDLGEFDELDNHEKILISKFTNFTTYFTGYNQNRMNMYSDEAKSTSIANRLITQNLPRFIDNIAVFEKIKDVLADKIQILEEEFGYSICDFFQLATYSKVLRQKDIKIYNTIIGGCTEDVGVKKIQGLNEYINLYNQQVSRQERLPKFTILYKQILSERGSVSFLPEKFDSDNAMLKAINDYCLNLKETTFDKLKTLLSSINTYDGEKIYLKSDDISLISQHIFGDYGRIAYRIKEDYKENNPKWKKVSEEKYAEQVNNWYKKQYFAISYINKVCETPLMVETYYAKLGEINTETKQTIDHFSSIAIAYEDVKNLLNSTIDDSRNLSQEKDNVAKIKKLLDELKNLQRFVKPLLIDSSVSSIDFNFYGELRELCSELNELTKLYDKVRNHLTRKPYSEEKVKLHFDNNANLLGGWVDSITEKSDNGTQYGGYLFRKKNTIGEYDYYLGISSNAKLFRAIDNQGQCDYERLDYYQPKSNTIYGNSYVGTNGYNYDKQILIVVIEQFISEQKLSPEIEEIKSKIASKIDITPKALLSIIREYPNVFNKLAEYSRFKEENIRVTNLLHKTLCALTRIPKVHDYLDVKFNFFDEVQNLIDEICEEKIFNYFPISNDAIFEAMNRVKGRLYLFKITNKDLSFADTHSQGLRKNRGKDNLHTMYFKQLMSGNQSVLDIGTGAVFFRKLSIRPQAKPTHPANIDIENKNPLNLKRVSKFDYDLVKDRRYTIDKFQLHLSIVLNYKKDNKFKELNNQVNKYIAQTTDDIHVIGVDRGERHLLYFTVVNQRGEIVEQYSMNTITNQWNGVDYVTDYHQKLEEKNIERTKARQDWQTIENIKELKEGYLSQVVHKVAQLMEKYNAILVLEDLNSGFKRGRIKVEHQVYQRFEKQLIEKLNYLVFKDKEADAPGGLLRAYQWAAKFESFERLGKQSGFIYYIPAWNTSKIDPVTGFVNLFYTRYESVEESRKFFSKFDIIRYNAIKDYFEFAFDYNNFHKRAEDTRTKWTLCTVNNRIENVRTIDAQNHFESREIDLTAEYKVLFAEFGIDINDNLKQSIVEQDSKKFFEKLYRLFHLTLQMRNSKTNSEIDYLLSPVADANGNFYNSELEKSKGKDVNGHWVSRLPVDADANGAYNIARKGLMLINQLKETGEVKAITNKDWLNFVQQFDK